MNFTSGRLFRDCRDLCCISNSGLETCAGCGIQANGGCAVDEVNDLITEKHEKHHVREVH